MTTLTESSIKPPHTYENIAWSWMRYSGFLVIILAFGHVILQDVIVGVHAIDLDYVAYRWASIGWRIYDGLLLAFAFAHGMNGVRQVLNDFVHQPRWRAVINWGLLVIWLAVTLVGMAALVGGVRPVQ
jgi:succinate dehydrogenase / fumarate reductase membrane anchor subunit